MKGDFTRFTYDPEKHYSGVLEQQGRVSLDADWNEYVQIQDHLRQSGNKDIIGRCGIPHALEDGFKIARSADSSRLDLSCGDVPPARMYVDGLMCEQEKNILVRNPDEGGTYLVYLDAWQQQVTAVEDNELFEVALGGPDTTTRVKTEWQVRWREISKEIKERIFEVKRFSPCSNNPWWLTEHMSTGAMAARTEQPGVETLCEIGARGGYRGLENRLYRVEIHDGGNLASGHVTFKWSRDNGSVVFPIDQVVFSGGKSTITLRQTGKDNVLTLHIGDWVEVSDDHDELNLKNGVLAQVADGSDMSKGLVVLETNVSSYLSSNHAKVRRWDQKDTSEISLVDGTVNIGVDEWIPLEDGVEVCFKSGKYHVGDYWLIPARTRIRDIIWDKVGEAIEYKPRFGVEHHYCALALAKFSDGVWSEPYDLRCIFPSLNELKRTCCLPVHPGEDIQKAVDRVVAMGGGCIRLCRGTHVVDGMISIRAAKDLTISGDDSATVVRFRGLKARKIGGFILEDCAGITLENLVITGDDLPALVTVNGCTETDVRPGIKLANLTVLNRSVAAEGELSVNCAVKVGDTTGVTIDNCKLIAECGIISLLGAELPDAGVLTNHVMARKYRLRLESVRNVESTAVPTDVLNYGIGVHRLRMKNSMVEFKNYGVWSLKSVGWRIENCRMEYVQDSEKKFSETLPSGKSRGKVSTETKIVQVDTVIQAAGAGVKALMWKDCIIEGCTIAAADGLNISFWLGGAAANNVISSKRGIVTLWQHRADWRGNKLECRQVGILLSGTYRSAIARNQIRARLAVANEGPDGWLGQLDPFLAEIVLAYGVSTLDKEDGFEEYKLMAFWMLLQAECDDLGLAGALGAVQELLDTFESFRGLPALLLAAVEILRRLGTMVKRSGSVPMPIISFDLTNNDIEARDGILLSNFVPLGGFHVDDNKIQTLSGRAIEIKAHPYSVNPYVIIIGWHLLYALLPSALRNLLSAISLERIIKTLSPEQLAALMKVLTFVEEMMIGLNKVIESVLKADYRISGNSIRSRYTAIETNIFELAIENNHITMEETEFSNKEAYDILSILQKYEETKDLAAGMRQRSVSRMCMYAKEVDKKAGTTEARAKLVMAADEIKKRTTNVELQNETRNLSNAADKGDVLGMIEALGNIAEQLGGYVDTSGIWIKGAGCRVVGNHVVVPLDAEPATWSQGGIRFWDDEGSPVWLLAFLEELLDITRPDIEVPSMVGATETLIANNEVLRGIGNGIEIDGITNMLFGLGLVDVKIRGNQIQDMAGAGISFDENSLTLGADIEGNRILDCGSSNADGSFVDEKGGIVVRNTNKCRIHNNRIRCSSNLDKTNLVFAIDLQEVAGLSLTDNYLQHFEASGLVVGTETLHALLKMANGDLAGTILSNLFGAIRLTELSGEAVIHNNSAVLSKGIGVGLVLANGVSQDRGTLWRNEQAYLTLDSRRSFRRQTPSSNTGTPTTQVNNRAAASDLPPFVVPTIS